MKFGELNPGKYLAKTDFPGPGRLVTIKGYTRDNVAMENQPPEMKPIVHFYEFDRGMVLNPTNQQLLMAALGLHDDSDVSESLGKKVVVYVDPSIAFGGRVIGGLRIRAPRIPAAPPAVPAPEPTHGILGKPINRPEPTVPPANPVPPAPPAPEPPFNPETDDVPF